VKGTVGRVTLQTIADRVGVSRMTVSNAFSRPDQLSPAMRRRILVAADELGYVGPDPTARALARGSTGAVGVLLTESLRSAFTDEIATGFLRAVAGEFEPTGLALTLLTTSTGSVVPARDVALDGAIVYSCVLDSEPLRWLRRRRIPQVHVDLPCVEGIPNVTIEDRAGARAAARHLVELGHHRIALILPGTDVEQGILTEPPQDLYHHVARERLHGWMDVLGPAGGRPVVLVQPKSVPPQETTRVRQLLEMPRRPTAVLCYSDLIAVAVLDAAAESGLDVPGDLSVVGFDDAPLACRVRPGLTTIRQDVEAKGRAAARILTGLLSHPDPPVPSAPPPVADRIVLPVELVIRGSTAPPPQE
jgi:DNA-binding LacI/PurR family transcriptional regulator